MSSVITQDCVHARRLRSAGQSGDTFRGMYVDVERVITMLEGDDVEPRLGQH